MKNGQNERFQVRIASSQKEIEKLELACIDVSHAINIELLNSTDPRPLTNPVVVHVAAFTEGQTECFSNVWIEVNSTWPITEKARLKLRSFGYEVFEIT